MGEQVEVQTRHPVESGHAPAARQRGDRPLSAHIAPLTGSRSLSPSSRSSAGPFGGTGVAIGHGFSAMPIWAASSARTGQAAREAAPARQDAGPADAAVAAPDAGAAPAPDAGVAPPPDAGTTAPPDAGVAAPAVGPPAPTAPVPAPTPAPVISGLTVENSPAAITYQVPSNLGGGGRQHWVNVASRSGTEPVLRADVTPAVGAGDPAVAGLQWTINGTVTPPSGDVLHVNVPRTAGKRVVRATLGGSSAEVTIWSVFVSVACPGGVALSPAPTGAAPYVRSATANFRGTIHPASIIADADRPNLAGANTVAPTGNNYCGVALSGGVDHKWDMSRQLNQTVNNPAGIVPPAGQACFWSAVAFPANTATGNDDTTATDENNDPYAGGGVITSIDTPRQPIPDALGADGNTLEFDLRFREFARLEYNRTWWRVSQFFPWRVVFRARKVAGRWRDNGSTATT